MWSYRAWRRRRILERNRLPERIWDNAFSHLPILDRLGPPERARLIELAILFLHEKTLEPTGGLELDQEMAALLALQACLPILNLDLDWYRGWYSVIVYPGRFVSRRSEMDEAGVVHDINEPLAGESWHQGPVVLAWEDVVAGGAGDGYNLIIHELAHKLDMLDGEANGLPPLHREVTRELWTSSFSRAYEDLQERLLRGEETEIDPYAGEAPEEFFAVTSEYFFELPELLLAVYPEVYRRLAEFYRQDPAARTH